MPDDNSKTKPKPEYGLLEMPAEDVRLKNDFDDMVQGLAQKYLLNPFMGGRFTYERPAEPTSTQKLLFAQLKEQQDRVDAIEREKQRFARKEALMLDAAMREAIQNAKEEALELIGMQQSPPWDMTYIPSLLRKPAPVVKPNPTSSPSPEPLRKGRMVLLKDPE